MPALVLDRPGESPLDRFRRLTIEQQLKFVDNAPDEFVALLLAGDWSVAARPAQQLPEGDWFGWLVKAGRGFGKTRTGAEGTVESIRRLAPRVSDGVRWGLIAPTLRDVRGVMILGESGLHRVIPPSMLLNGSWEDSYNKGEQVINLDAGDGSEHVLTGYTSEKPRQLRGPQHHGLWLDEPAEFKDAHLGYSTEEDTTFDMAVLGCRLPPDPRIIVTGTPKNNKLIRDMLDDPDFVVTGGSSYENLQNLASQVRRRILQRYEGTRLGRQELMAEVLEGTGLMFQRGWWNFVDSTDELPGNRALWRWTRYWDLAATEPGDSSPDPDYTAGALLGVHPRDRNYCIAHIARFRLRPGHRDDKIKQIALEDGIKRIYIEQEKAQAGKSTVAAIGRHLDDIGIRVEGDPVSGGKPKDQATGREGRASEAKVMRAELVAGAAQQGRVYVVRGRWTDAWLDEAEEFPNGTHFDQIDAVSGAAKVLGEKHEGTGASVTTMGARSVAEVMDMRRERDEAKASGRATTNARAKRRKSVASVSIAR